MYKKWWDDNKEILSTNGCRIENQMKIAEFFKCKQGFDDALQFEDDVEKLTGLQRYRILVRCIIKARMSKLAKQKEDEDDLTVIASMVEGNNRIWDYIHLIFNAKLSEADGVIEEDSLTKDWIIPHLLKKPGRNKDEITRNLQDAEGELKEWIEKEVQDETSVFSVPFRCIVHYPTDVETFRAENIDIDRACKCVIAKSHNLMMQKKMCADVPIRTNLANDLFRVVDEIEMQLNKYPSGLHPNFSANGGHYVEHEPVNKTFVQPKDSEGNNIPNWERPTVNVCKLWESKAYEKFELEGTVQSFQEFVRSHEVGLSIFKSSRQPHPIANTCHGPFVLTVDNMMKVNMDFFPEPGEEEKIKVIEAAKGVVAQTISKEWENRGRGHMPLTTEEYNKVVFMTMAATYCFQAGKGVNRQDWYENGKGRHDCREELRFLVQANAHTQACASIFGQKLGEEYKSKSYAQVVGLGSTVMADGNENMCAVLFIADAMNACLTLGKKEGLKKVREFISFILHSVYDSGVSDKEFMDILGESMNQNIILECFEMY